VPWAIILIYLYENVTSYAKPEVHKIAMRSQRSIKPSLQITCTDSLVKLSRGGFREIRADRQTDRHAFRNTSHRSWEQSDNLHWCSLMTRTNTVDS